MKHTTFNLIFFMIIAFFMIIGLKHISDDRHEYLHEKVFNFYECENVTIDLNLFMDSSTTAYCPNITREQYTNIYKDNLLIESNAYPILDILDCIWLIFGFVMIFIITRGKDE